MNKEKEKNQKDIQNGNKTFPISNGMSKQIQKQNSKPPSVKTRVFERIESECLTPRAKWLCRCSEHGVWLLWILALIVGAIGFSELMYVSLHSGMEYYELTHGNLTVFLLDSLPFIWIVLFLLMVGLAYFNFRNTSRGYRYPFWQIVGSSLIFTLLGGFGLHAVGVNQTIDRLMSRMPMPMPYMSVEDRQAYLWAHPEDGRITGVFMERLHDPMQVRFVDAVDREWLVSTHELQPSDLELLVSGERVRLLGEAATSSTPPTFYSCAVMPWMAKDGETLETMKAKRAQLHSYKEQFGLQKSVPEQVTVEETLRCREILQRLLPPTGATTRE